MRILVASASKHGATTAIADMIGRVLGADGRDIVTVVPVESAPSLSAFDAVVIGSAVQMGRWLAPARRFVTDHGPELRTKPVWMFSSGPIGDPLKPEGEPPEALQLRAAIGARDHRVFAGKLDRSELGIAERAITAAVKATDGDFRPWGDIEAWAAGIARELAAMAVAEPLGVGS
ncbi:MAG TPA: flavodoxin domain-containing protein [Candidatus Limnocylindrales bacterium]|nr:flavodoxin domain-containing protein [Candidatus Limnocylindrales bacterium]